MWTLACCGVRKSTLFIHSLILSFSSAVRPYKEGFALVVLCFLCNVVLFILVRVSQGLNYSFVTGVFYCAAHSHKDVAFESLICGLVFANCLCRNVRKKALGSILSTVLFVGPCVSVKQSVMSSVSFSCPFSFHFEPILCLSTVLDVYVLSTDGQVQDFKFPQSSEGSISIQLSANTVKLNSRNGKLS